MPSSSTERAGALVRICAIALLALFGFGTALVLGEAVLRLTGYSYLLLYTRDDATGSALRPNASGWSRREGEAFVRINSHGLRADREYAFAKPPGVLRIAVLGDSFAQAAEVPAQATFWAHLERELNACPAFGARRVEVLNFGVSGYGTAQELLTLRHRAWRYQPDIVLLAFFPGNDVRNNSRRLERDKQRPFFVLHNGELALDDSFRRDPQFIDGKRFMKLRAFLAELRLYQLMRQLQSGEGELKVRHNTPIAAALAQGKGASPLTEPGLDENVLREPQDEAWKEAWIITEKLLLATAEEARRGGARFVLATLSNSGAVHPERSLREAYAAHLGVPDLFYPDRRLAGFAERHGIEIVTLGPEMQRRADATGAYYHGFKAMLGFGHWNPAGHEIAGKLIARRLCPSKPERPT